MTDESFSNNPFRGLKGRKDFPAKSTAGRGFRVYGKGQGVFLPGNTRLRHIGFQQSHLQSSLRFTLHISQ